MLIAIKDLNTANADAAEQREQAVQSNLARLLATENIHVAFRKANTASFNVKTRVLVIPIYAADLPREVVQMLVGHEVGHALFTPESGWHEAACARGMIYKGYMNVVEDARIERKIKDKYPGLRRDFHFGYAHMIAANFFGPAKLLNDPRWIAKQSLIDKINLHFKAVPHIPAIKFTERELELVDAIEVAETFEDVLKVTDTIWKYDRDYRAAQRRAQEEEREAARKILQDQEDDNYELGDDDQDADDGLDSHDTEGETPPRSEDNEDDLSDMDGDSGPDTPTVDDEQDEDGDGGVKGEKGDKTATEGDLASAGDEIDDLDAESDDVGSGAGSEYLDDEEDNFGSSGSVTDRAFREHAANLIDASCRDIIYAKVNYLPEEKDVKLPYKKFVACLDAALLSAVWVSGDRDKNEWLLAEEVRFLQEFRSKHERFIIHLVREFEMKRNAWTSARAREARTGALNLNKLYQYKFNDDLFKKVTMVPNGKNHGMIMLIDTSGSMARLIDKVLEQAAVLAMFCRRVQIPFRVYGFTNPLLPNIEAGFNYTFPKVDGLLDRSALYRAYYSEGQKEPSVNCEQYVLTELLTDRMSLRDFNRVLFGLFSKFGRGITKSYVLPMYGTPLNDAILTIPSLVKNMRQQYKTEKVSVIVLTDGMSDNENMIGGGALNASLMRLFITSPWTRKVFEVKPVVRPKAWGGSMHESFERLCWTKVYIQMAADASGASIIGYHVVNGKMAARMLADYKGFYTKDCEDMKLQFRNDKMMSIDNFGYKQYFIMWDKALNEEDKTMQAARSDMTARKLATMFSEVQRSQQVNRVFLSKFVEMIA
jgi:hypothetical protein